MYISFSIDGNGFCSFPDGRWGDRAPVQKNVGALHLFSVITVRQLSGVGSPEKLTTFFYSLL